MNAEIICVGTEILLGNIVNTNSAYLSNKLSEIGINLYYHTVVGDNEKRLLSAIEIAKSRSDLIILTGGLGPTYDDITKETVAKAFGKELYLDTASLEAIKEYFKKAEKPMTDNNIKQAYVISGSTVLENNNGTAPGMVFSENGITVAILPGPPNEMSLMYENELLPILKSFSDKVFTSHTVRIYGIGESKVESDLKDMMVSFTDPTIAPYAKPGEVELRITSASENKKEADEKIFPIIKMLKEKYPDNLYGVDVPNLETQLVKLYSEKKKTVAFAESCTGGLVAKRVTDVSGASSVIGFSAVTYSNNAKMTVLGVPDEVLSAYGAISSECAKAMAKGIMNAAKADVGISVTGCAGPDMSEEKPVGLVYIGVCKKGAEPISIELHLAKSKKPQRDTIRTLAASRALFEAIKAI